MLDILKKYCSVYGPSGRENGISDAIREYVAPYADEVCSDALGNLIAIKRCGKPDAKKLMFCAHMDQIGLIVTYVEPEGWVRFGNIGGVSPANILHRTVIFENGTVGVVEKQQGANITGTRLSEYYIDTGDGEKTCKKIFPGDVAVYDSPWHETEDSVISGALDNRFACAALTWAFINAKDPASDIYAVFTTQEEVGLRGARVAGQSLAPDAMIAVDVTSAGDLPSDIPTIPMKMGAGATVKIKDASVICHPGMVAWLKDIANANGVIWQPEILTAGGTDAGAVQLTGAGVPVGGVSVPTRYIHSAVEMCSKSDIKEAGKLLLAAMENEIRI